MLKLTSINAVEALFMLTLLKGYQKFYKQAKKKSRETE